MFFHVCSWLRVVARWLAVVFCLGVLFRCRHLADYLFYCVLIRDYLLLSALDRSVCVCGVYFSSVGWSIMVFSVLALLTWCSLVVVLCFVLFDMSEFKECSFWLLSFWWFIFFIVFMVWFSFSDKCWIV